IFENPIVRDKLTGLPMVRSSIWKGHLRFAAERVNDLDGKNINEITKPEINSLVELVCKLLNEKRSGR
ncbi:RAMP superfamily CRISPR-associated protein, partial [Acetomicrobium sp. S15 = DSM 107314]|uniref:RAMP superfamily CRISPR-associated protein n=1 Tax=Acetomicrobium sp. S15 = DSM 107314 TaxID=2529858 RepID=UPI0018E13D2E